MLHRSPSRERLRPHLVGLTSALQVHGVLSAAPCASPLDPDERARLMTRKLQTGNPSRWAEIVRDLTWHQRKGLANTKDVQLLQQATRKLSAWLAAQKGIARARAKKRIRGTVERTVSIFVGAKRDICGWRQEMA